MVSYDHVPGTSLQIGSGIGKLGFGLSVNDTVGAVEDCDGDDGDIAKAEAETEELLVDIVACCVERAVQVYCCR